LIDLIMDLIGCIVWAFVICLELIVRFAIIFAVFIIGFALLKIGGII